MLNVCKTLCNRDVSVCLCQFNTHYASKSIFSWATLRDYICLLVRITNRWYVRNHFIFNVIMKTTLFSFNTRTVTFFLTVSNLFPRGSREAQLPPFPAKNLSCHISRTRPTICTQLRSSLIHFIHQKSRDFIQGNCAYLACICASLIRARPRGEEGNCSYLLPLSHRECIWISIIRMLHVQMVTDQ